MKKRDECSRIIAGLMELAERYGVKVKESSLEGVSALWGESGSGGEIRGRR